MSKRKKIILLINIFWFISYGVMAGGKEDLMVASAASDHIALRDHQQPRRHQEALPKINGNHPQDHIAQEFVRDSGINTVGDLQNSLEEQRFSTESAGNIDNWLAVANAYRHMGTRESCSYAAEIYRDITNSTNQRISNFQKSMSFLRLAKIANRRGQLNIACGLAQEAVEKDANNHHALYWYGEHAAIHGCLENEDIIGYLSGGLHLAQAAQDARPQAKAHIGLGNMREGGVQIPHYLNALRVLGCDFDQNGHLIVNPHSSGNVDVDNLRAQAYIGLGNARDGLDGGIAHYLDALRVLGCDFDQNGHLIVNPLSSGNVDVDNLRVQAYIGLGNAHYGAHNFQRALDLLDLLGRDRDVNLRAQALIGLGNAYNANKQNAEAIRYYDEALGLRWLSGELIEKAEKGKRIAQYWINNDRMPDRSHPNQSMGPIRQHGGSHHRSHPYQRVH